MSTIAQLRTMLEGRVGFSGSEYTSRLTRAIIDALKSIHSVDFNFLYKYWDVQTGTTGESQYIITNLNPNIRSIDTYNVWRLGFPTNTRLTRTTPAAILSDTTTGAPLYYAIGDVTSSGAPKLYIGLPRSSGIQYTIRVYGWEGVPSSPSDTYEPIVSLVYGDKPIISCAAWHFFKNVEEFDKSKDALREFLLDMSQMEATVPYTGTSFFEKNKIALLAELSSPSTVADVA